MEKIKLLLSLDELNLIFSSLGKEPYVQVFDLIHKIHDQTKCQLQETENGQQKIITNPALEVDQNQNK